MKNRAIFGFGIFFLLLSFLVDKEVLLFITNNRITFLNDIIVGFTHIMTTFIILIVITSIFLWRKKKEEYIIPLILGFFIAVGISIGLKYIIMRPRPFIELAITPLVGARFPSFPSLHAASAFTAVAILDKEFPRLKWAWIIIAVLVCFSRMYVGVHYLSDLIAGGLLGYLLGLLIIKSEEKYKWFRKFRKKK
ncbi:phosphatase PAP2 family protein [Candidatus Woesearchaeota archaeon]|nr:phosphatase PAP2 family protein [Candidatus Woesearchaeota archaeon]